MVKRPQSPSGCAAERAIAGTGKRRVSALFLVLAAAVSVADTEAATAAIPADPNNPTCPRTLDWSTYREMRFTLFESEARRILKAEGMIDADAAVRLKDALKEYEPIDEIWLRSPGGDARVGNQAGTIIRKEGIPTRIPQGWACFSACNFIFMGG